MVGWTCALWRRLSVLRSQRSERRPHLAREDLRLLPRREVAALVELVVMDEFGKRPLCPTARGLVDLIWKGAHGDRDGDVLDVEKRQLVFPADTSRRDRG